MDSQGGGIMGQPQGLTTYRLKDIVALKRFERGDIIINFGTGQIWNSRGLELIGNLSNKGYLEINLSDNGMTFKMQKHRVIYVCYHGLNSIVLGQELEINHKDGNKTNNAICNLEMVTGSENCRNPNTLLRGEKAPHSKITNETAEYIRELYLMGGFTTANLGAMFGLTHQSIENILNNRTYKSGTETARRAAIAISTKPRGARYKPTEAAV